MNIDSLYQKTILEYSRLKDYHHEMLDATDAERGHNPSCGDDLSIVLKIHDTTIEDASFVGNGCAISTASTNMLLSVIKGKKLDEAKKCVSAFFAMMNGEELSDADSDLLGDAALLEMTATMPARKKCATLSWHSARVIFEKY